MSRNRPNILFLFADQQRFDTIAALGNPLIHTPHLDRLVHEGTAFTRAYSPSPECVPARACLITGYYPGRTGCYANDFPMPAEQTPTFMSFLRDADYRVHGIGKCHFTPDPYALRGFETRDVQEEMQEDRFRDDYARWLVENGWGDVLEPHGVRGEMYYVPQPSVLPEKAHPTRWVGDRALDFLDSVADTDRPWCLYGGFVHPHPPFAPPVPWHKIYRAPDMPLPDLPENRDELLSFINYHQNRYKYRDRGLDLNLIRCMRAYYYACITFIDSQVGRILQRLEQMGQLDRTLIVYSADHGEYLGDYGCFGKRGMHDVSARIPLIARWPGGVQMGTRCERPVSLVDLAPTFVEAAGVTVPEKTFDGISLQSVRDGSAMRDWVYSQYQHAGDGLYMATNAHWKYVYSAPDQREYLFDLDRDPREQINLATSPESANELETLRLRCQDWARQQGQLAALEGGRWRSYPVRTMPSNPDEGLIFQDPFWWDGRLPEGISPRKKG